MEMRVCTENIPKEKPHLITLNIKVKIINKIHLYFIYTIILTQKSNNVNFEFFILIKLNILIIIVYKSALDLCSYKCMYNVHKAQYANITFVVARTLVTADSLLSYLALYNLVFTHVLKQTFSLSEGVLPDFFPAYMLHIVSSSICVYILLQIVRVVKDTSRVRFYRYIISTKSFVRCCWWYRYIS